MAERTNVAIQQRTHEETPDRSAVAIRQDIAAKRDSISETVDKLGERIQETFDWREYIGRYPVAALGLAAGAGFLVAGIFKRNPTPQERIIDAVADLTEEMTDRVGGVMAGVIQKKLISGGRCTCGRRNNGDRSGWRPVGLHAGNELDRVPRR